MPNKTYRTKELSWLSFNERLLQEANKKTVPLIERLKFLGIYSNNLDEFFRVRVAILKRIEELGTPYDFEGINPHKVLKEINQIVLKQSNTFSNVYDGILADLKKNNIYLINENQINENQQIFIRQYFQKYVQPRLMPLILNKDRDLPDLKDDAIYMAVELKCKKREKNTYVLIEIPSNHVGRFIILPDEGENKYIMLLDDAIRFELKDLFYMFEFDEISSYVIKLTRDAELDLDDEISENYVKQIAQGLERRKEAPPVRFIYDKKIPQYFLDLILKKLRFSKDDAIIKGGRYHNFKDFMNFPKIGGSETLYESQPPIRHKDIDNNRTYFEALKKKDILLHFPYHSFTQFIDFLREASIDPQVIEIKITIYRVAKSSNVMNALINAARNGKKVSAILELQARFDEGANIKWSNRLKDEGVKVIYGVPGLKVHSKLCLITRKVKNKLEYYAAIGTGNFNEDSAKVFSDNIILTSHSSITKEVSWVFEFFDRNYKVPRYQYLMVSPFQLRAKITNYITNEIKNARKGHPAYIHIKCNNVVDKIMINRLYQAKQAGVDVKLNVRGMCSLVPDFDPKTPPIESIGLIDRYLEHSRMFIFCNNGDEKIYISSADLMTRNLDRRIEVACPILDPNLKEELKTLWNMQWRDNTAARILDNGLTNTHRTTESLIPFRSQLEFYNYLNAKS